MINSPTFQYVHIYTTATTIVFHFDLYRLKTSEDFLLLGFDEHFSTGITLIEWAERIEDIIPQDAIRITMKHEGDDKRIIDISYGREESRM